MLRKTLIFSLFATSALAGDLQFTPRDVPPHAYTGGWEHFVGGGIAAFDCDGDNRPELYAAGGAGPAQLMRNTALGPLKFTENTPDALALSGVIGAYPWISTVTV